MTSCALSHAPAGSTAIPPRLMTRTASSTVLTYEVRDQLGRRPTNNVGVTNPSPMLPACRTRREGQVHRIAIRLGGRPVLLGREAAGGGKSDGPVLVSS